MMYEFGSTAFAKENGKYAGDEQGRGNPGVLPEDQ